MKIEDFLDKKEARQLLIIRQTILIGGKISETDLTDYLGISKASLENDITDLGYFLTSFKEEFRLTYDGQWLRLWMAEDFSISQLYNGFVKESLKFQLIDYLYRHKEFTIAQLTTKFMISESSLFRKIKEVNKLLEEFDIQIKNGHLQGEELQIRYFFFQLYWYLTSYEEHQAKTMSIQNQRTIIALEKALAFSFNEHSSLKISLWLTIAKKRINVPKKNYRQLQNKMVDFQEDPLFKQIRQFVFRFFSRYPFELDEGEAWLHFVFLTSMSVLSQADFSEYALIRRRRSVTSLADTFVLENVVIYYRPQKFEPNLEKTILYYFSQIHGKLYFLKGELELFDRENIWQKEQSLSSHRLADFSRKLLDKGLECFDESYVAGNSLHELSLIKYLSVLAIIDFKLMGEIRVAIDLDMDPLYEEVLTQVLLLSLKSLNGTSIESYNPQKSYGLIVTNHKQRTIYQGNPEIYVLSELGSAYDIQQLKVKIRSLHRNE